MSGSSVLLVIVIISQTWLVYSEIQFRLGRDKGGNLKAPMGTYNDLPDAQWFDQRLDHFTPPNLQTWKQRYFINKSFFNEKDPGPVFLMIGGEGPADARWVMKGAWIEYARKCGALCIQLEHRYYGESHPTVDLSTKNLMYLSSHQALADIAYFIEHMNEFFHLPADTKWIAFGGSYPGALAAWLRLRYPHLVYAAISSSGPLLAKIDFNDYYKVVVASLHEKTGSDKCANVIKEAHTQITALMKTDPKEIENSFKVCDSFSTASENDINNFYNNIADDFAGVVQYNEDKRISDDNELSDITINSVCDILTQSDKLPAYERLAAVNSIILKKNKQSCMDYKYENMINELRNTTWNNNDGARQWTYQTCTEFGFYQTLSSEENMFGNNFTVDFYIKQCEDIFGKKFNKEFIVNAIKWTNNVYGGKNISMSRVMYIHGSIDPWHALGITSSDDAMAPAIYISGTAHCANMYPSDPKDSRKLKDARVAILKHLTTWCDI